MLVCLTSTASLNQALKTSCQAIASRCQFAFRNFEFQQNGYKLPVQPKEVHTFIAPVTPTTKRDPDPSSCEWIKSTIRWIFTYLKVQVVFLSNNLSYFLLAPQPFRSPELTNKWGQKNWVGLQAKQFQRPYKIMILLIYWINCWYKVNIAFMSW